MCARRNNEEIERLIKEHGLEATIESFRENKNGRQLLEILFRRGFSIRGIADYIGCSHTLLHGLVREYEINLRSIQRNPIKNCEDDLRDFLEHCGLQLDELDKRELRIVITYLYGQGHSSRAIGKLVGYSHSSVARIVKRNS